MIKTAKAAEVRGMAETLFGAWENSKNDLKISGRALYNLIGLKKELEKMAIQLQDTITELALQNGGSPMENGAIQIPEDKKDYVNEKLLEFSNEVLEIEYSPVVLREEDSIPPAILEAIFEFVEFRD